LQSARRQKVDILTSKDEVLTDYQVAKYWKADIIDRYIHFVIPKLEPYIQTRFKTMILNLTKQQRENITYEWIKQWVEKQKKDEEYYS
jgi:ABC-type phosphate/phosphonate transport system substrate-binding protein